VYASHLYVNIGQFTYRESQRQRVARGLSPPRQWKEEQQHNLFFHMNCWSGFRQNPFRLKKEIKKATTPNDSLPLETICPHKQRHTPTTPEEEANWAVDRATSLPEVWALVAKHRGVLGARRLMRVCRAAREGATEFLSTLPGLVVCGGEGVAGGVGVVSDV
jgi:hypothetical protein